jgi:hypothetical protein
LIFLVDDDGCVEFTIDFIDINHVLFDFKFIKIIIDTPSVKAVKKATRKLAACAKRSIFIE